MQVWHFIAPFLGILLIAYTIGLQSSTIIVIFFTIVVAVYCLVDISQDVNQIFVTRSAETQKRKNDELRVMRNYLKALDMESRDPKRLPAIFGRTIDDILQKLIDLLIRDFVIAWNKEQGFGSSEQLSADLKEDIWKVVQNFQARLANVDGAKLICDDFVSRLTYHFQRIRQTKEATESGHAPIHGLPAHLESSDAEHEYLRHIVAALMTHLVPSTYMAAPPVKHVVRELLACKVLYPAVETLTDPDFINQKIISWLSSSVQSRARNLKDVYSSLESYEEFVQIIRESTDMQVLKQIRYDIVVEVIQASSVHNRNTTDDVTQSVPMSRYINQLSFAKNQCEKRLNELGWMSQPVEQAVEAHAHKQTLPIKSVLEHAEARVFFKEYLEHLDNHGLMGFWEGVEEIRKANRCYWHKIGTEVFYKYIHRPPSSTPTSQPPPIDFYVSKAAHKKMEEFLLGNAEPDGFFITQDKVVKLLEERFFPAFVESDNYKRMIIATESCNLLDPVQDYRYSLNGDEPMEVSEVDMPAESDYTRRKLSQLQERLKYKKQALEALKTSLKPDSRILIGLESEVETLVAEVRQLEAHVIHTEEWGKYLGQWRSNVSSVEVAEDGVVQFTLVVHRLEDNDVDAVSTGWVLLRKLEEFHVLHRKLSQLSSATRAMDIPYLSRKFPITFGHALRKESERMWLPKAQEQIQRFLKFILEDEKLNHSEALYTFLSPSSDHLKHIEVIPKKSKFSFTTLFKSNCDQTRDGAASLKEPIDGDASLLCDEPEGSRSPGDSKDTIAEPLFGLLNEICDLNKSFKWIRRTLITTIQVTYNRTINRATRVIIAEWFSVHNVYLSINAFINSWWPSGTLVSYSYDRRPMEKRCARTTASRLLQNNIPLVVSNLVGLQNAQLGVKKVFDALQDQQQNKKLFYELLDIFICELYPEFKA